MHAFQGTRWTVAGEVGRAQGNHHPSIAPYGLFHCRDGSVQIALGSEGLWRRLCDGRPRPAADSWPGHQRRAGGRPGRVIRGRRGVFADWDAEPLLARLAELGVPAGKVRTLDEVYAWDQTASQGMLVDVDHPTLGRVTLPGPPCGSSDPTGEADPPTHAAPPLDEDQAAVAAWLDALSTSKVCP